MYKELIFSVVCILFATDFLNAQDKFDCDKVAFDSKSMVVEEPLVIRSVEGTVVTEDGMELLPEVCVVLFREDDQVQVSSFRLGKNHRFNFKQIRDGRYRLVVKHRYSVYCLASIPVVISSHQPKGQMLEIVMKPREIDICSFARLIDR